jgi:homocysteine S-methyltransferase
MNSLQKLNISLNMNPYNLEFPLLIDGGHSTELERQGYDLNHSLWTARFLADDPQAILNVHKAYLDAGAKCIETFSYQASIGGFISLGYSEDEAKSFIMKSVELAETAINQFIKSNPGKKRPLIAASIGPYGASLADGSEYHGNYVISDQELKDFHLSRIHLLDKSNADMLAIETIPSYREALVIADILNEVATPAWMSFSCKDEDHINDGTPITSCADLLADHPSIIAIGVNCTSPSYISGLIKNINDHCGKKRIIVYPNSGEVYNAATKTWSGITTPSVLTTKTREWLGLGADIIGGCCRISSHHIKEMATVIESITH